MSLRLRRCALCLALLSLPVEAGSPREDRRSARLRPTPPRPEREETAAPTTDAVAASAADASGVDQAGFLGMLAALAVTYVYARGRRLDPSLVRPSRPSERR